MFKKLSCLTFAFVFALASWAENIQSVISYYKPDMSKGFIFISKTDMTLTLVNSQGKTVVTYPMACGRVSGQKKSRGDNRTPEGHFLLQNIHDASSWGHDFRDGKGFIKNAYGPWFLRLQTGFAGIGIHGTHAPQSIGTRASEGCIRLNNNDLSSLKKQVTIGMPVIIGPEEGVQQLIASNIPSPKEPGARGLTGAKQPAGPTLATTKTTSTKDKPAKPAAPESDKPAPVTVAEVKPIEVEPVAAAVTVVDGMLDVEPETDLEIIMPAEELAAESQSAQPETTADVADAEQPVVEAEDQPAAETAMAEQVTEPETAENAEEPEVASAQTDIAAEPEPKEPRYEVVVEEVTGPDGEVKFEVRYKRID